MPLFVVSCGANRPSTGTWPATVVQLQNFSSSQRQQITAGIQALNTALGTQALSIDTSGENQKGYPITLEKVANVQASDTRAGYAYVQDTRCDVQLSSDLFDADHADYFQSVLWHELGHCAGLLHVSGNREIMSPIAVTFSQYSAEALSRFRTSFLTSSGLQ